MPEGFYISNWSLSDLFLDKVAWLSALDDLELDWDWFLLNDIGVGLLLGRLRLGWFFGLVLSFWIWVDSVLRPHLKKPHNIPPHKGLSLSIESGIKVVGQVVDRLTSIVESLSLLINVLKVFRFISVSQRFVVGFIGHLLLCKVLEDRRVGTA